MDESGVDIGVADEPELQVNIDTGGGPVFFGSWDDADTGERWPGLADKIASLIGAIMAGRAASASSKESRSDTWI